MTQELLTASTKVAHLAALMMAGTAGPEHFVEPLAELSAAVGLFIDAHEMDGPAMHALAALMLADMQTGGVRAQPEPEPYTAEWLQRWVVRDKIVEMNGPGDSYYSFNGTHVFRNTLKRCWASSFQEIAAWLATLPDDTKRESMVEHATTT